MGVYDSILVPCPNCGEEYEAQTKSGLCVLAIYKFAEAPADALKDVNRHAPFTCSKCAALFFVDQSDSGNVPKPYVAQEKPFEKMTLEEVFDLEDRYTATVGPSSALSECANPPLDLDTIMERAHKAKEFRFWHHLQASQADVQALISEVEASRRRYAEVHDLAFACARKLKEANSRIESVAGQLRSAVELSVQFGTPPHDHELLLAWADELQGTKVAAVSSDKSTIRIVKATRTSYACPSQWDCLTDTGKEVYIRYRWGTLSASYGIRGELIAKIKRDPGGMDGLIIFQELKEVLSTWLIFDCEES